jgi:hypothetical protein
MCHRPDVPSLLTYLSFRIPVAVTVRRKESGIRCETLNTGARLGGTCELDWGGGRGYLAFRGTGNHDCLDSLLSLSSVSAFHSCSSCALRQQLQAPVRLLHTFRRPSFGTFSLQFFSQDSENFDGIRCQNCFDRIGNMLHLFQPTICSSAWQCVVVCLSYYTKLSLSLVLVNHLIFSWISLTFSFFQI